MVIPEKAEVEKKMINKHGVAVKIGVSATRQTKAYEPIEGKKSTTRNCREENCKYGS